MTNPMTLEEYKSHTLSYLSSERDRLTELALSSAGAAAGLYFYAETHLSRYINTIERGDHLPKDKQESGQ